MGSGLNWCQIWNKTRHIPKVGKCYIGKRIYVNSLKSVIFSIFYRLERNAQGEPHGIEF